VTDEERPVSPSTGWGVLHLFCRADAGVEAQAVRSAVKAARDDEHQVVTATILGHKADLCFMALGPDLRRLRRLQTELQQAGLRISTSFVSLTELSEYAAGLPEEMRQARLYPRLPPDGMTSMCFYPMSKRREAGDNWYSLAYDERLELMKGHGAVGREFRGRVLQLITGSTGLDDWEWGVTLFAVHPDDLKECVYRMRFDEASARFADFGPFLTGIVASLDDVLEQAGIR
jgi:chlorite dismutase